MTEPMADEETEERAAAERLSEEMFAVDVHLPWRDDVKPEEER